MNNLYENEGSKTLKITREFILNIVCVTIFFISFIYGIIMMINEPNDAQNRLITLESAVGMLIPLVYVIFAKVFKINISFYMRLFVFTFAFFGIVLGESFRFYYNIPFWDKILHTISGFFVTWIGYSLCYYVIKDTNIENKVMFSIVVGIMFSLAFAAVWEFYEYSVDSILGLNMQKTMPTDSTFFNGGDTNSMLNGTDSEIAAFYRTPEGYRYAIKDTMTDMLLNALGSIIMGVVFALLNKFNYNEIVNNTFTSVKNINSI